MEVFGLVLSEVVLADAPPVSHRAGVFILFHTSVCFIVLKSRPRPTGLYPECFWGGSREQGKIEEGTRSIDSYGPSPCTIFGLLIEDACCLT